jgi:hypothetical protein
MPPAIAKERGIYRAGWTDVTLEGCQHSGNCEDADIAACAVDEGRGEKKAGDAHESIATT